MLSNSWTLSAAGPLPTLLVWWLPRAIGQSYLAVFFSWEPHRPETYMGRSRDIRCWRFPLPRFLQQSMPVSASI